MPEIRQFMPERRQVALTKHSFFTKTGWELTPVLGQIPTLGLKSPYTFRILEEVSGIWCLSPHRVV
jgi:hypothetical protein